MTREATGRHESGPTIRGAVDGVFGRWPAWPWSMVALIVAGGIAGAAAAPALRSARVASVAALGTLACAGYGVVLAGIVAVLPRVVMVLRLAGGAARRPATIDDSWWPLRLLPAALVSTPRWTDDEFRTAVAAAAERMRGILADRLWPVWAAAFVAPVLGLMTAWQNGGRVQLAMGPDADAATVFPALVTQVSPPMVGTIAAALVLMVIVVAVDQWTKVLVGEWREVVMPADGRHPHVVGQVSSGDAPPGDPALEAGQPSREPEPKPDKLPKHRLSVDEIRKAWNASAEEDR